MNPADRYGRKCLDCGQAYDARDGHECPVHRLVQVARARRGDPDTSQAAAIAVTRKLQTNQLEVLRVFAHGHELADIELVRLLQGRGSPQSASGIRTRRKELQDAGLVRVTRKVRINGRKHRVFAAVAEVDA